MTIQSLKTRPVEQRPDQVRLSGRALFLVDDAELVRRQLGGEDLPWPPAAPLRDNISTDEITPAYICYYYDERLGDFPYLGLKAGGEFPITPGSVKAGGFVCSVAGKRRGKRARDDLRLGDYAVVRRLRDSQLGINRIRLVRHRSSFR